MIRRPAPGSPDTPAPSSLMIGSGPSPPTGSPSGPSLPIRRLVPKRQTPVRADIGVRGPTGTGGPSPVLRPPSPPGLARGPAGPPVVRKETADTVCSVS